MLKIEAFILCHNESKFIRHTLNHYQQFCSKITVIDNESSDNTRDIITKEYPKVIISNYGSGGVLDDGFQQQIKNECWKNSLDADWVIVCDMDELLYHPDLVNRLQAMTDKRFVLPMISGYNMFSETFPSDYSKPITEQVKNGVRAFNFDKQIIFDPKCTIDINYSPGAHNCNAKLRPGARYDLPKSVLSLLHYKYLGEQHLIDRHMYFADRLSEFNKEHHYGAEYLKGEAHVKQCFDIIRNSGKIEQVVK